MPSVTQLLGQHPDLRRRRRLISAVLSKNVAGKIRQEFSKSIRGGNNFIVMGKKKFPITSQASFLSDLEGVLYTLDIRPRKYYIFIC